MEAKFTQKCLSISNITPLTTHNRFIIYPIKMEKSDKGVKLVGYWVSPFVHRVRWALTLKGIEYEYIEEDIFNKSPLLSELNPVHGKVPVLVHDGNPIPESSIILEYVDQTWKHEPLLAQDPYLRSDARFWAKFADKQVLGPAWLALCSEVEIQEKAVKLAIENLEKVEEKLTKLKGKSFFGGDTIGYVDIMIGFVAYMLPVWEEAASVKIFDPLKFPAIAAWKNNFLSHPVIKGEYLPAKAEMLSYFQWRRKELIPVYAAYGNKIWSYVTQ